jgi:hypothetical protein
MLNIYHRDLITLAVEKCMEFISLLADERNPEVERFLYLLVREIFNLYLIDRSEENRYFFRTLLNQSLRGFFSKSLIEQITLVEKHEEELKEDLEKIRSEEAEQFRMKREKIMQKKKLKEEMMRKNQKEVLSRYTKEVEELKAVEEREEAGGLCIYCKEETPEPLSLISYVGLTNLIERSLLKQKVFHYFFSTCGHRIHASCFMQANDKAAHNFCFLCKQHANILLPQLGLLPAETKVENGPSLAADFANNVLCAILNENELSNGKIGNFENLIFEEGTEMLLTSLAKELAFNGLHDYAHFRKNIYPLHLHLFAILKQLRTPDLTSAFDKLRKHWQEGQQPRHKLELLVRAFEVKMEEYFVGRSGEEEVRELSLEPPEVEQVGRLFEAVVRREPGTEISELKEINADTLFVKVPSSLTELHEYMGKCKNCPNITNNIFLCLVCGWSACLKCVKEIFRHVSEEHVDGAIVMGCSTGTVKYFRNNGIFEDASIYENYMGLNFSEADSISEYSKAEKYTLNREKERELHKKLLRYEVHQKVHLSGERSNNNW